VYTEKKKKKTTFIAHPAPHQEVGASSSGINIDFESRRSTIRDVMEALKGKQINPIVICGMGGVGKTTLVGEVVNRAKREGVFDEYAKAVVTETPDLSKIQRDVAEYLGLPLTEQGFLVLREFS
jgi:AAA+ ATPase superfamily predicted ATPase